jgi:hypothetical protein
MATDLQLRGLSAITQRMYLSCVFRLPAYCRRSPAELGEAEVRAFLDHLVHDRHLSRSTHGVYVAALHFSTGSRRTGRMSCSASPIRAAGRRPCP